MQTEYFRAVIVVFITQAAQAQYVRSRYKYKYKRSERVTQHRWLAVGNFEIYIKIYMGMQRTNKS